MNRRRFLETALMLATTPHAAAEPKGHQRPEAAVLTLFLCGDVMMGRGIDQILPHPGDPRLYEPWVTDAGTYVRLAEAAHGPITRPVDPASIWGDALEIIKAAAPDVRLVNLETAVTRGGTPWAGKDIHYRMHPENIACLTAAGLDCAVLANNHVLDWALRVSTRPWRPCTAPASAPPAPAATATRPRHRRSWTYPVVAGYSSSPSASATAASRRSGARRPNARGWPGWRTSRPAPCSGWQV